jgi:hypothetical protein
MYAYARAGNYVDFDVHAYYIHGVTGNRIWQTLDGCIVRNILLRM